MKFTSLLLQLSLKGSAISSLCLGSNTNTCIQSSLLTQTSIENQNMNVSRSNISCLKWNRWMLRFHSMIMWNMKMIQFREIFIIHENSIFFRKEANSTINSFRHQIFYWSKVPRCCWSYRCKTSDRITHHVTKWRCETLHRYILIWAIFTVVLHAKDQYDFVIFSTYFFLDFCSLQLHLLIKVKMIMFSISTRILFFSKMVFSSCWSNKHPLTESMTRGSTIVFTSFFEYMHWIIVVLVSEQMASTKYLSEHIWHRILHKEWIDCEWCDPQ